MTEKVLLKLFETMERSEKGFSAHYRELEEKLSGKGYDRVLICLEKDTNKIVDWLEVGK